MRMLCLAALAFSCVSVASRGQTLCSSPLSPTCATSSFTFQDPSAVERCRAEIASYRERMAEYQVCLDKAAKEAAVRIPEIERAFECRARGEKDCK
jgi:hypothetical protein